MPGAVSSKEEDQSQCSSQEAYGGSQDDEDYTQRPATGEEAQEIPSSCCLCSELIVESVSASAACSYEPENLVLGTAGAHFCRDYCRVHLDCLQVAFSESQVLAISMSQTSEHVDSDQSSPLPHRVSCRGFCGKTFGALHPVMAGRLRLPEHALLLRQTHVARLMRSMHHICCGPQTVYNFVLGQVLAEKPEACDCETLYNIQVWIRADGGETLMPVMMKNPVAHHLALLFYMRFAMFPPTAVQPRRQLVPLSQDKLNTLRYLLDELNIEHNEAALAEADVAPWSGRFVEVNLGDGKTGRYPIDAQGVPLCNAFDTDNETYPFLTQRAWEALQGKSALQHAMNVRLDHLVIPTHQTIAEGMVKDLVLDMQAAVNAKTTEQAWMDKEAAKAGARREKTRHTQARKGFMEEAKKRPFDMVPLFKRLQAEMMCSSRVTRARLSDIERYFERWHFYRMPGGDLVLAGALSQQVGRQEVIPAYYHTIILLNIHQVGHGTVSQSTRVTSTVPPKPIAMRPPPLICV
jgi:hypothetical protein